MSFTELHEAVKDLWSSRTRAQNGRERAGPTTSVHPLPAGRTCHDGPSLLPQWTSDTSGIAGFARPTSRCEHPEFGTANAATTLIL